MLNHHCLSSAWIKQITWNSELHGVYFVVSGEGEASAHVLCNARRLIGFNVLDESIIDGFLEGSAFGFYGLLFVFVEYVSALGLGGLVLEGGICNIGNIDSSDAKLSARGDRVHLVDALEGYTVHFEGAADEEETRLELLEEDNSSATISAGGKDEDAARFDALAQFGCTSSLPTRLTFLVLSRVPIELFDH